MSVSHKKAELFNDFFKAEPGHRNHKIFSFDIKHDGKINHKIIYQFSVDQSESSTDHKMYCYVFAQQDLTNWFLKNLNESSSGLFLTNLKHLKYSVENVSDKHKFTIKRNTILFFVFVNWYVFTITKNVKLEITEEWDEPEFSNELSLFSTIPPYDKSLLEQSQNMIESASDNLKIITPYIDMSLILPLLEKFDNGVDIQIITRSRNDFSGKSSKEAFDYIKQKLGNGHKYNSLIHSRLIIKDNYEALVSSSDLTQDSLLSQFNVGIVTTDEKIIKKLSNYFTNVWNNKKSNSN